MSRTDKLNSLFQKEISTILMQDLNDPKLGFATVSEVKTSGDLSSARVYVSFLGKNYKKRDGLDALNRSKGFIKSQLAKRLNMRKIPDLIFVVDDSIDKAMRIEEITSKDKE